jgi:hypothetical protein
VLQLTRRGTDRHRQKPSGQLDSHAPEHLVHPSPPYESSYRTTWSQPERSAFP